MQVLALCKNFLLPQQGEIDTRIHKNPDTSRFLIAGVPGLDTILGGGRTCDRLFLIEGEPGTGTTTLALQFLHEGVRRGESVIYITLAETQIELKAVAQSHGWSMDGINDEDIISNENILQPSPVHHFPPVGTGCTTLFLADRTPSRATCRSEAWRVASSRLN